MTEQEQEKKNKRIAALSTTGIQVLVVFLLFIIVAWRAPNPPLPEYGIELNFGLDTEGSGDIQPETPVGNEGDQPEESAQEEKVQEEPEVKEEVVKEEAKPTDVKEVEEQPVSKVESPVVVKEKKPEPSIEKPKEKVEEKKVEKQPEVKKEQPKAVYKPSNEQATAEKEGNKEGTPGNHGDDKDKTGDKGSPEGKLDAKALYGQPGGGGGGVSMSGFNGFDWPKVQPPTLPDGAYGVYEFIVKVDADGTVVKITPVQRGLSLDAQRKLMEMIQQLEFIPKGNNTTESEGKITFKVVSK
jgi:outer membrane biosynthesis protein TonB